MESGGRRSVATFARVVGLRSAGWRYWVWSVWLWPIEVLPGFANKSQHHGLAQGQFVKARFWASWAGPVPVDECERLRAGLSANGIAWAVPLAQNLGKGVEKELVMCRRPCEIVISVF